MCTSIAMQQGGGLFGRNLDLEYSFGEQVVVTPRRYPLRFRRQPPLDRHLAMVGMAGQHTPSRLALPRRYRYTAMARLGRALW